MVPTFSQSLSYTFSFCNRGNHVCRINQANFTGSRVIELSPSRKCPLSCACRKSNLRGLRPPMPYQLGYPLEVLNILFNNESRWTFHILSWSRENSIPPSLFFFLLVSDWAHGVLALSLPFPGAFKVHSAEAFSWMGNLRWSFPFVSRIPDSISSTEHLTNHYPITCCFWLHETVSIILLCTLYCSI